MKKRTFLVGDPITWKDTDGDEPELRTGRVLAELSEQYLVQVRTGCERFVFKNDPSLCLYQENYE